VTDAPDETTLPDATSDSGAEPRDHADRAPSVPAEEPTADADRAEVDAEERTSPAAVPRPPRPGQRVPRRATAPSPRTAPAVVVAPTPPRLKSTSVAAPAARTAGTGAEDGGDAPSTTSRPPRVRRRTRVQRAAGSAEADSGAGPAPDGAADRTTTGPAAGSPATPAAAAAVPAAAAATPPDQDALSELRGMFAEADPPPAVTEPEDEDQDASPTDGVPAADPEEGSRAAADEVEQVDGVAQDEPVVHAAADAEEAEGAPDEAASDMPAADAGTGAAPEPDPEPEPSAPSAPDADLTGPPADAPDVVRDEGIQADLLPGPITEPEEADAGTDPDTDTRIHGDTTAESEPVADRAPAAPPVAHERDDDAPAARADPAPARTVTVRTDSLTAPRSSRPGLAGVAETALTPSVRGDRAASPELGDDVLVIDGLTKRFDEKVAVDDVALTVRAGSFYGIVGPNGAGKTTTMSMVTGLLRPDAGTVTVNGIDVWRDPLTAKRSIGVLPDRLRLFDRLTGAQLLHYSGALRGLDDAEIRSRSADLVAAFGLEDAVGRLVTDYSAGMTKKVALACAMIHSPRMLVLDEPFESVDPVSAANVVEILQDYVAHGGTVVLSSHGMDFIQRICDHVAIIVNGRVLAAGTMDEVRAGRSLEERFVALAGGRRTAEGFSWLHSFSD
jgi:ABC-type multidrug transport system ATPase subunit